MKRTIKLFSVVLILIFVSGIFAQNGKKTKRSLAQLQSEATSARPDGKDFVFYIKGSAYSYIPGERPTKLFNVEGYNIRRRVETPEKDGFFLSTREIVFYKDPKTDAILSEWENPWTKEKCEVFHIQNDPVNGRTRLKDGKYIAVSMDGKREFGESSLPEEINDQLVWTADVFPFYPLPGFDKNYTASEMFDFYVEKDELNKTTPPKNVVVSWTRVGPWLPWMKMGGRDGMVYMHTAGRKLLTWEDVSPLMRAQVETAYPAFRAPPPVDDRRPNETSLSFYRKMREAQAGAPAAGGN